MIAVSRRRLGRWILMSAVALSLFTVSACGYFGSATVWQCWCTWRCVDGVAPDFSQSQAACALTSIGAERDSAQRCENIFPTVRSCARAECVCNQCKNNPDVACVREDRSAEADDSRTYNEP